jgi:hypothetical protein
LQGDSESHGFARVMRNFTHFFQNLAAYLVGSVEERRGGKKDRKLQNKEFLIRVLFNHVCQLQKLFYVK